MGSYGQVMPEVERSVAGKLGALFGDPESKKLGSLSSPRASNDWNHLNAK
jgi:hypothetical protein